MSYNQVILGERIEKQRKLLGMSREKLAERLDLSTSYVGALEGGRKNPSLPVLWKIHKLFGKPLSYFLIDDSGIARETAPEYGDSQTDSKEIDEIVSMLQTMNDSELEYINGMIRQFKKYNIDNG